ncbi:MULTISPECIES: hypothetical protein [Bacteria]|uniref:hypothetical protein n=1 Tax=Bacteria TaxID=2 RepID=UPI001C1180C8|nr:MULTISPECIES: hypothetical protein [Bacteria]MCM3583770.1 hypothetical protein [Ralstonia pickettii]
MMLKPGSAAILTAAILGVACLVFGLLDAHEPVNPLSTSGDWHANIALLGAALVVAAGIAHDAAPGPLRAPRNGVTAPRELWPELEAAALRYAAMSPSEFHGDTLHVAVTKLRDLGMVTTTTWARVPAHVDVRVLRDETSTTARVLPPTLPSA